MLLQLNLCVLLERQQIVEQNKCSVVDNLWITTTKTLVAELNQSLASLHFLHHGSTIGRRENIGQHFKTHLVEIVDRLGLRVRQVLR